MCGLRFADMHIDDMHSRARCQTPSAPRATWRSCCSSTSRAARARRKRARPMQWERQSGGSGDYRPRLPMRDGTGPKCAAWRRAVHRRRATCPPSRGLYCSEAGTIAAPAPANTDLTVGQMSRMLEVAMRWSVSRQPLGPVAVQVSLQPQRQCCALALAILAAGRASASDPLPPGCHRARGRRRGELVERPRPRVSPAPLSRG